jgi:pyridoxine kinase
LNILSIQSHVSYGHVGNSAAVFVLQRLGIDVWPINTVQFSNHTGYGDWRGQINDAALIGDIIEGIEARGVLGECDGVLSGYIGDVDIGRAIVEAVSKVRVANPAAHYCCDPVIGDTDRGIYVRDGVPEFLREVAVPAADIVTPNQFELEYLSGRTIKTLQDALAAADALLALGARVVLVTSLETRETPADSIDLLAVSAEARCRVRTPKLTVNANGAGDALAALFLARFLEESSIGNALSLAASSIHAILHRTQEAGSRELLLIEAQEELIKPSQRFRSRAL